MAVNTRSKFTPALSPHLLGNVLSSVRVTRPYPASEDNLLQATASSALSIRQGLLNITEANLRDSIAQMDSLPDISIVGLRFRPSPVDDVITTSWANFAPYELDWGDAFKGQHVSYVRPPDFDADGVWTILPRFPDGGIEVAVYLRKDDMAELKAIRVFREYATLYET